MVEKVIVLLLILALPPHQHSMIEFAVWCPIPISFIRSEEKEWKLFAMFCLVYGESKGLIFVSPALKH